LRPVFANRRALAWFGPAAAGEGPDWARALWGEDANRLLAAAAEVLREGGTRALEHASRSLDGKARRMSTLVQVGRVRDGRPATLLALLTELAEAPPRGTAAADARGSRDDLGSILHAMPAGITVQDETGKLLFVNEGAARACGFS